MKYILGFILLCAMLLGFWQSHRLDQAEKQEAALRKQIAAAKEMAAAANVSRSSSTAPAPQRNSTDRPLDISEFFELAGEISAIEARARAGKEREQMQTKIATLYSRLAVTPEATLKKIMEQLPGSSVSDEAKKQVPLMILNALAKTDPAGAVAYALQLNLRPETVEMAVRSWARQDAGAAAAWLEKAEREGTLPADVVAADLRRLLLPAQIAANPAGDAVEGLVKLKPEKRDEVLADTLRKLGTPEARLQVFQKIAALPESETDAVAQFIKHTGREISFEAATALLKDAAATLTPARYDRAAAAAAVARIDEGTAARADWLLNNMRDTNREPAIRKLMESWAKGDFNAAGTWLRNQPASADHDAAIAAYAPQVAKMEPPSAVDWAATIANPDRRKEVLSSLYKEWQTASPAEAEAYFQKKGLSVP